MWMLEFNHTVPVPGWPLDEDAIGFSIFNSERYHLTNYRRARKNLRQHDYVVGLDASLASLQP